MTRAGSIILSPIAEGEGARLRQLPLDALPHSMRDARCPPTEVWISRLFLVQVLDEDGYERVTVNRTAYDAVKGRWVEDVSWDDLQELKAQIGRGDRWAVELYPADASVVNVASMRHLWLLEEPPAFGWNR